MKYNSLGPERARKMVRSLLTNSGLRIQFLASSPEITTRAISIPQSLYPMASQRKEVGTKSSYPDGKVKHP